MIEFLRPIVQENCKRLAAYCDKKIFHTGRGPSAPFVEFAFYKMRGYFLTFYRMKVSTNGA